MPFHPVILKSLAMIEKVFLLNMKLLALLKQKLTENRDL